MSVLDQIRARRSAVGDATWAVMDVNDPGEGVNFVEVYAEADGLPMVCRLPDPTEFSSREFLQADAAFIAHAPADIDKLLALVDAVASLHQKETVMAAEEGFRELARCQGCHSGWPCLTATTVASALERTGTN